MSSGITVSVIWSDSVSGLVLPGTEAVPAVFEPNYTNDKEKTNSEIIWRKCIQLIINVYLTWGTFILAWTFVTMLSTSASSTIFLNRHSWITGSFNNLCNTSGNGDSIKYLLCFRTSLTYKIHVHYFYQVYLSTVSNTSISWWKTTFTHFSIGQCTQFYKFNYTVRNTSLT